MIIKTKVAFWIVFVLAVTNFAAMTFWTMPALKEFSTQSIFDLRLSGYSFSQAVTFLEALGPRGIHLYATTQHNLDTSYPALLALSMGLAIFLLTPKSWGKWQYALALIPLPGMAIDYLENALILLMLDQGPGQLEQSLVEQASGYTILKFQLDGIAGIVLLLLFILWIKQNRFQKPIS